MSLLNFLGEPAWQGAGAIVATIALMLYIWFETARRQRRSHSREPLGTASPNGGASVMQQSVEYFLITDEASERKYYDELAKHIQTAEEAVLRTGRGFQRDTKANAYSALMRAEEVALANKVDMLRIQMGGMVAEGWAKSYAALLERYPESFRIVADFDNAGFSDVAVIDPHGRRPVVNFLFESRGQDYFGTVGRPEIALIITGASKLAITLAAQMQARADDCPRMSPHEVRGLAQTYLYFGWGIHMASRKLLRDAPGARRRGTAVLRQWRRNIEAMLAGPADRATITETAHDGDSFDGVAYDLSGWDKMRLDRLEKRAYQERDVTVEIDGREFPAFTYVPLPRATEVREWMSGSWIDLVLEGALENKMSGLLAELHAAGAPVDQPRGLL